MPIIQKLSHKEAQKIAAGEVIERPASVVKELMENSLDAGATCITVTINDGGRTYISCADDGSGMDPIDARASIQTHTTSKIRSLDDLFTLTTFGFRGEALASISAVSTLQIITKEKTQLHATYIKVEDGIIVDERIEARDTGTTIIVENLFKTVPARLKFLKKDETEQRHITQLFDALCLAHPKVHAKLIINGTTHTNYPATESYLERAQQILLNKTYVALIPLQSHIHKGITVEGAISTHQTQRFDKSGIYMFVNHRWVKNIGLSRAVMRAYTVLPEGKFPVVSLHIMVDPAIIDVNMHPRKEEVAFTNSAIVEQAVTEAITKTLESELLTHIVPKNVPPFSSHASLPEPVFALKQPMSTPASRATQRDVVPHIEKPVHIPASLNHAMDMVQETSHTTVLGQLDATYILSTTEQGLTIVDQHAAHERILYEQFVARFGTIETVQLLFPEIVTLPPTDYELILQYQELFNNHGIIAEPFGSTQIRVTALPVFAKHISVQQLLMELITTFHEVPIKADALLFFTHALRAQMACKAAVKAGDTLTTAHMQQLLRDLAAVPNKLTCPHGRPTYWAITVKELEKKFQRVA